MKELKELRFEDLSIKQKIGMTMVGLVYNREDKDNAEENVEYILELIRNHSLGAVWVIPSVIHQIDGIMERIKGAADYPILIITDAEGGIDIDGQTIGGHNSIGVANDLELAYEFGKTTAIRARKLGYNVVCDPVVDLNDRNSVCGGTMRSMGGDKEKVVELSTAIAQGLKDGGVLAVAKHYGSTIKLTDSHMAPVVATVTKEELLDYWIYPYLELNKKGLLDGIMTSHNQLIKIDPDYPVSLSSKSIDIIREQGFDGFAITDALDMMGIVAKYGRTTSKGLAIQNGNDLSLVWTNAKFSYEAMVETYEQGILTEERINIAAKRVLAAQSKTLIPPKFEELTQDEEKVYEKINNQAIAAVVDEGLTQSIDPNGNHYFVVLCESDFEISAKGKVDIFPLATKWHDASSIIKKIQKEFPNSYIRAIHEFPVSLHIMHTLEEAVNYDDVVMITFIEGQAYVGIEKFTPRIESMINALQATDQIAAIIHAGNPYALEDLAHIPRKIFVGRSIQSMDRALDVLAGKLEAKGKLTYDVKFK